MSSLKVEVEAKVSPTAKVEQPIPVLANSIPIGGSKGQVLTKKSGKPYDVAWENPKGGEGGGDIIVEGVTEERVEEIVSEKTADLQPKTDERLETESKQVVGAINEVNSGLVKEMGSSVNEETNELTVELKDKSGKVIASTKVFIPKGEVPDLSAYVKNTDIAKDKQAGLVAPSSTYGMNVNASGGLLCQVLTLEDYSKKPTSCFVSKGTLENIKYNYVKVGLVDSNEILTDEERAKACEWLGAVKKSSKTTPSNGSEVLIFEASGVYNWRACNNYPIDFCVPRYGNGGFLKTNMQSTPADNDCVNVGHLKKIIAELRAEIEALKNS